MAELFVLQAVPVKPTLLSPAVYEGTEHLRPCVLIASNFQIVQEQGKYTAEVRAVEAMADVVGAFPLILPALAEKLDLEQALFRADGLMIPGGISNVHPSCYGRPAKSEYGPFDRARDATTLPLIRAALEQGVPMLMTCRGLQELNVALGGSLKLEPNDQPEAKKHGTPASARSEDERFRIRQDIELVPGGMLAKLLKAKRIRVNSLHRQIIDQLAPRLVVEADAEDGSVEAASVGGAKNFALGVIFHPEYWAERDAPSLAILQAFGEAVRRYADSKRQSRPLERANA